MSPGGAQLQVSRRFLTCAARISALCLAALAVSPVAAHGQEIPAGRNLVVNGGFEEDNYNLRGERMCCPVRPRVTYGQRDGLPDGWTFPAGQAALTRDSHSGARALRTAAGKSVTLTPTLHTYAVQTKSDRI
jgi:hypothetical protein